LFDKTGAATVILRRDATRAFQPGANERAGVCA
jgi:hypothetical protein